MKKIIFLVLTLLLAVNIFAQSEPSNYMAMAALFKNFYNNDKPDSIFSNFSPELKAELPEDRFKPTTIQLKQQIGPLLNIEFINYEKPLARYKATFQNAVFSLNISLNNKSEFMGLVFTPYQGQSGTQAQSDPSVTESPVLVKTFTGAISGTLSMPKNASGKIPVVLIIPGTGSVDRDGNNPKVNITANTYKLMAEALGKSGIAALRYDKRMVGESTGTSKEENLRFDDYVDDGISLINFLKEDSRFSKVIVLGHSEGSLAGMLAVSASEGSVNGYISVDGTADRGDKVLPDRMKSHPQHIADGVKRILDSLRVGKIQRNIDPDLYFAIRPSIQYFIMSWCGHDPQKEIKQVKIPTLIVQGTTDLEVSVDNADKLKKNKNATVVIIPGMNYVLKAAPADKEKNLATYAQPDLPVKPELITDIVDFVQKLK
jgi:pimeloyl-ACP methyl ester carboxylesterase